LRCKTSKEENNNIPNQVIHKSTVLNKKGRIPIKDIVTAVIPKNIKEGIEKGITKIEVFLNSLNLSLKESRRSRTKSKHRSRSSSSDYNYDRRRNRRRNRKRRWYSNYNSNNWILKLNL